MDIALRAAAFTAAWSLNTGGFELLLISALQLAARTCYSDYIGQDFYNAGRRKEVVQAADFLIKEARMQQEIELVSTYHGLFLMKPRLYSIDEERKRAGSSSFA
jgi:hypothetical protein